MVIERKGRWTMAVDKERVFLERAKVEVAALIANAGTGISDPQAARVQAKETIEAYKEQKGLEFEQVSNRFKLLQRLEFIIGALFLIQIAVLFLFFKGESIPLIFTAAACFLLYIVVAVFDSKAKRQRQQTQSQIVAAKKVKLKNGAGGVGVVADFD
jgi:hypothetical protein